jgi:predicted metal-binding protein
MVKVPSLPHDQFKAFMELLMAQKRTANYLIGRLKLQQENTDRMKAMLQWLDNQGIATISTNVNTTRCYVTIYERDFQKLVRKFQLKVTEEHTNNGYTYANAKFNGCYLRCLLPGRRTNW